MGGKTLRTLLTVLVNILFAVAIALAIRQCGVFFARLAHHSLVQAYNSLAARLVIPFGFASIKTPYGGVFDVDNALTVALAVGAEWILSGVRDRA